MARRMLPLFEFYTWDPNSDSKHVFLIPKSEQHSPIEFQVVKEETTRALSFLRQDADILFNTLSLTKTHWIQTRPNPPRIFSAPSYSLSVLGFSQKNPILKDIRVRQAISKAIPLDDWIHYKLFNWTERFPLRNPISHDVERANAELDQLGYSVKEEGLRFSVKYISTSAREGAEAGLLVQEALKKIKIGVQLSTLDPVLYFQKMKKGEADLFSIRWFRFTPQESIASLLKTGGDRNYFGISDSKLDARLELNPTLSENELEALIQDSFPFMPLYTWKHGLILSERIEIDDPKALQADLDETFRFLLHLHLK
jgi:ABC-type transport system substrate-binding protein